jgi:glycosyltransferase involved in cell wall biosynthesis
MSDRVNILLTTYNGSLFLREQLESFQSQTHQPHRITIRDDGSTDDTMSILSEWTASRPNTSVLTGPNLGVTKNFFTLLAEEDRSCDYFAFADQDDVWLPNKIENAVASLSRHDAGRPLMYCSRVEYVDEGLVHLGYSRIPGRADFANALVENIATGCTAVLNRRARDLVIGRLPEKALIHDWWCYLVVSAFGTILYDHRPGIKYRQHARNLTGGTASTVELFRRRLIRFFKGSRNLKPLSDQALEFRRCFGDVLTVEHRGILERFLEVRGDLWTRLRYNTEIDVWRQTQTDTLILRVLILMGRV